MKSLEMNAPIAWWFLSTAVNDELPTERVVKDIVDYVVVYDYVVVNNNVVVND